MNGFLCVDAKGPAPKSPPKTKEQLKIEYGELSADLRVRACVCVTELSYF